MQKQNDLLLSPQNFDSNDINSRLLQSKPLNNKRKQYFPIYIYFIIAILLIILVILFFIIQSSSSKLSSLELEIKELEVNHQRDYAELKAIEDKLQLATNTKNEANEKQIMLINKYKTTHEDYKGKQKLYNEIKEEKEKLFEREREIEAKIRGINIQNTELYQIKRYGRVQRGY